MQSLSTRAAPLHADRPAHYVMNSPLLFSALEVLDAQQRVEVLDVLPAHAGLLAYFARLHCKLYLPACRDALLRLSCEAKEQCDKLSRQFARLLHIPSSARPALNIVLLWDLPNYLPPEALRVLIEYLTPRLARHAMLHVYVHTREQMPQAPGRFRFTTEARIAVDMAGQWTRQSPMYHRERLHKLLDPFRVERGMLLSNGMQEFILRT